MATIDAYIDCQSGNMCISHGNVVKELRLYPLAKPTIQQELPLCSDEEEFEQADKALQIYMIEQSLAAKKPTEDELIRQFMTNSNPYLDFIELFSSVCATQQIDMASISSMTPNVNSKSLTDSAIKDVEIEPR